MRKEDDELDLFLSKDALQAKLSSKSLNEIQNELVSLGVSHQLLDHFLKEDQVSYLADRRISLKVKQSLENNKDILSRALKSSSEQELRNKLISQNLIDRDCPEIPREEMEKLLYQRFVTHSKSAERSSGVLEGRDANNLQFIYQGQMLGGYPHGSGKIKYPSTGIEEEGTFEFGFKQGLFWVYLGHHKYRVNYVDGLKHGECQDLINNQIIQQTFENGELKSQQDSEKRETKKVSGHLGIQYYQYQGETLNDLPHGKGVLTIMNGPQKGYIYNGTFRYGLLDGDIYTNLPDNQVIYCRYTFGTRVGIEQFFQNSKVKIPYKLIQHNKGSQLIIKDETTNCCICQIF